MRAMKATVIAVVLLGGLGLVASGGPPGAAGPVVEDGAAERLRRCGPMHYGEPHADCVTTLQHFLRARGAPIPASGNYLGSTTKYLRQFQTNRDLRTDGVLDASTRRALIDLPEGGAWDLRHDCVSLGPAGADHPASQGPCVTALRDRLAAAGLDGGRGETLDAAAATTVRAFQRRVGLPAIAVVGPQTKNALYGAAPATAGWTRRSCTADSCTVYLGRAMTRDLADAFPDNRLAGTLLASALSVLACHRLRAAPAPDVICQAATAYILDTVVDAVDRAATRHACVAIRLGRPPHDPGWAPLRLTPYGGRNCRE